MMLNRIIIDIFEQNLGGKVENIQFRRYILFLCLAGICSVQTLVANNKNTWKSLFGKNLSQAEYSPEIWSQQGSILLTGPEECIWTMDEYDNFELDLEFNANEGARGGIIIYCADRSNWQPRSLKIQLVDASIEELGDDDNLEICGAIHGRAVAAQDGVVKQAGQWNHVRVRCAFGRISVIMNGKKVTEWDMKADLPTPPTKGYIGLEGHQGESSMKFRNLKIREVKEYENKSVPSVKKERDSRVFPQY